MSAARSLVSIALAAIFAIAIALAGFARPSAVSAATPIPKHVYSPYFETWTSDSLTTTAKHSGARYFTLAFLETLGKQSCTLAWNGESSRTIRSGAYINDIH